MKHTPALLQQLLLEKALAQSQIGSEIGEGRLPPDTFLSEGFLPEHRMLQISHREWIRDTA